MILSELFWCDELFECFSMLLWSRTLVEWKGLDFVTLWGAVDLIHQFRSIFPKTSLDCLFIARFQPSFVGSFALVFQSLNSFYL